MPAVTTASLRLRRAFARHRLTGRVGLTAVIGGLLSTAVLTGAAPAPAAVEEDDVCVVARPDRDYPVPPTDAAGDSEVSAALRLADAHRLATGRGVGVAVIDTGLAPGVAESGRLSTRRGDALPDVSGQVHDAHGTWVAGIVAGDVEGRWVGIAPDAHVVPIKVADGGRRVVEESRGQRLRRVTAAGIARGIRLAVARAEADDIRIINISLSVREPDPRLERAVREATDAGLLVVAAAGNRPEPDPGGTGRGGESFRPGEDRVPYPAAYDDVLAVTALAADLSLDPAEVVTGPAVDVSAPVVGVQTIGVEGQTCLLPTVATSWAAPTVSGLAALLFERDPAATAAQVRARIEVTARGATSAHSLDGHGMVQPVAALTADLEITEDGEVVRGRPMVETEPPLTLPDDDTEDTEAVPDQLRWWGIAAGGVLLLSLIVRPLVRGRV